MKNAKATASALGAGILAALALVVAAPAGAANDPVYAGLITNGMFYQSGDDGLWHQVDKAALSGHVPTMYASLPGSIGYAISGVPAPAATSVEPKKGYTLAGLLKEDVVFVATEDDTLWHPIDAATRTKLGLDANVVTWYGSLPGSTGAPVGAAPALTASPVKDNLTSLVSAGLFFYGYDGAWHSLVDGGIWP